MRYDERGKSFIHLPTFGSPFNIVVFLNIDLLVVVYALRLHRIFVPSPPHLAITCRRMSLALTFSTFSSRLLFKKPARKSKSIKFENKNIKQTFEVEKKMAVVIGMAFGSDHLFLS